MDPIMQQYLMYALFTLAGYLLKHFFPQLPPLPSPVPPPAEKLATLGLTTTQLEAQLDAAFKRNLGVKP